MRSRVVQNIKIWVFLTSLSQDWTESSIKLAPRYFRFEFDHNIRESPSAFWILIFSNFRENSGFEWLYLWGKLVLGVIQAFDIILRPKAFDIYPKQGLGISSSKFIWENVPDFEKREKIQRCVKKKRHLAQKWLKWKNLAYKVSFQCLEQLYVRIKRYWFPILSCLFFDIKISWNFAKNDRNFL